MQLDLFSYSPEQRIIAPLLQLIRVRARVAIYVVQAEGGPTTNVHSVMEYAPSGDGSAEILGFGANPNKTIRVFDQDANAPNRLGPGFRIGAPKIAKVSISLNYVLDCGHILQGKRVLLQQEGVCVTRGKVMCMGTSVSYVTHFQEKSSICIFSRQCISSWLLQKNITNTIE